VPLDPTTRRHALSTLLVGFVRPTPPPWLLDALAEGLGGVVLFGSNVDGDEHALRVLTDKLRAAAGRDLIIALDEEGGDVTRLDREHGSSSPGAAALGYLNDVHTTESVYAAIGARLATAGVTVDLAPVADVNVEARNPVIGVRAFAADAERVSRHVAAAVRGLQSTGVAACVKHFPGHGATRSDSHHEVARLDRSRGQLDQVELAPFRAAIAAGAGAVMTGHLLATALDAARLATVSPAVTSLLRSDLGFDGTIVTDALEMRAVADGIGMVEGFVQALAAGADVVETGAQSYPAFLGSALPAVESALRTGRLTEDRLADASARAARVAAAPGAAPLMPPDDAISARCVEVIGSLPVLLRPLVVECRPPAGMAAGELPWSLGTRLAELVPGTQTVAVEAATPPSTILARAVGRTLVVVVRDPIRHAWQQPYLDTAADRSDAVIVDVGWPTESSHVPTVRTRGVAPRLLDAAAARLGRRGDA
jgi:beta-N-acetylhexosaminidase